MQEINLYRLLAFYVRNWLLILSLTLVGVLCGFVYNTFVQTPLYRSDATLLFINSTGASSTDTTQINNYVQLFKSRRVLEPVLQDQKINTPFDSFVVSVGATNTKGTEVINLSVSTDNPGVSRAFLREAVVSFKKQAQILYGKDNLSVVDNASEAEPPYNVKKTQQLLIATAIGFVVSLIVLFFIYDVKGDAIKKRVKKTLAQKKKSSAKPLRTTEPVFIRFKNTITRGFSKNSTKPAVKKKLTKKTTPKKVQKTARVKTIAANTVATKKTPVKKTVAKKPVAKKATTKKTTTKK